MANDGLGIIQFRFDSTQWINRLSFELTNLPLNWSVHYYNPRLERIVQLSDITGNTLGGIITGRTTYAQRGTEYTGLEIIEGVDKIDPNGWLEFSFQLPALETDLIEIHIDRNVPRDLIPEYYQSNAKAFYSYAIQKANFKFVVEGYEDVVPIRDRNVVVKNVLDYSERIKVKDWDSNRVIDGDENSFWRSAPQPIGRAIVPLHLDLARPGEVAPVIDAMRIDPVTPGPEMNIYFSNDDAIAPEFYLSRYASEWQVEGDQGDDYQIDLFGVKVKDNGKIALPDADIDKLKWYLDQSWSVGAVYRIDFDQIDYADPKQQVIWDNGQIRLIYDEDLQEFQLKSKDDEVLVSHNNFGANNRRESNLITNAWFDGERGETSTSDNQLVSGWRPHMSFDEEDLQYEILGVDQFNKRALRADVLRDDNNLSHIQIGTIENGLVGEVEPNQLAYIEIYVRTNCDSVVLRLRDRDEDDVFDTYEYTLDESEKNRLVRIKTTVELPSDRTLNHFYIRAQKETDFTEDDYVEFHYAFVADKDAFVGIYDTDAGEWDESLFYDTDVRPLPSSAEIAVVAGYVDELDANEESEDFTLPGFYIYAENVRSFRRSIQYGNGDAEIGVCVDGFAIGSDLEGNHSGHNYIRDVWIKQDFMRWNVLRRFTNSPTTFTYSEGAKNESRADYKALLLSPLDWRENIFLVRIGPDAHWYDSKVWTPIPRDFYLRRGVFPIPVVKAKFIKLEFRNLNPAPYKGIETEVTKSYYDFPEWVHGAFEDLLETQSDPDMEGRRRYKTITPMGGHQIFDETRFGEERVDDNIALDKIYHNTARKRFYRSTVHEYNEKDALQNYKQAYFVAIRNIQFYKIDFTETDFPQYVEAFDSILNLETDEEGGIEFDIDTEHGALIANRAEDEIVTKTFTSYSEFQSVQFACQATNWESQFSDSELSIEEKRYLEPVNSVLSDATNQFQEEGAGKVVSVYRRFDRGFYDYPSGRFDTSSSFDDDLDFEQVGSGTQYGIRTRQGRYYIVGESEYDTEFREYDTNRRYDLQLDFQPEGFRTSVIARVYLPNTDDGTYELRLLGRTVDETDVSVIARKTLSISTGKWHEFELVTITGERSVDLRAELVQIDVDVDEEFAVDFFGIFQNPILWEISNDGGDTWVPVLGTMNNESGYASFPEKGNQLKIRATAQRSGAKIHSFTVVPMYEESPLVRRSELDYGSPLGINESDEYRPTKHKHMFKKWDRWFPRRYSIDQRGSVPVAGRGLDP